MVLIFGDFGVHSSLGAQALLGQQKPDLILELMSLSPFH